MLLLLTAFVALVAVLCLLFVFATADVSVVPDDLLGEPGSCFAGC
jgi:hypothetical protein